MTYRILLRNDPSNGYVATALAWPECVVEAPTREEALAGIQEALRKLLDTSEIVEMEIPGPPLEDPMAQHGTFGMFRDDPTFDEFAKEVQAYRQHRNEITAE